MRQRMGNKNLLGTAMLGMAVLFCSFQSGRFSAVLQQKVDNAITATFVSENYTLKPIAVSAAVDAQTPTDFSGERLLAIQEKDRLLGYAYVGEAASKKRTFDYIVMLDPQLVIKKVKVLIYREDFGQQIGSQRWLKQFIGLSANDTAQYGKNIDAVSGATISASNMTRATNEVLQSLKMLREKQVL